MEQTRVALIVSLVLLLVACGSTAPGDQGTSDASDGSARDGRGAAGGDADAGAAGDGGSGDAGNDGGGTGGLGGTPGTGGGVAHGGTGGTNSTSDGGVYRSFIQGKVTINGESTEYDCTIASGSGSAFLVQYSSKEPKIASLDCQQDVGGKKTYIALSMPAQVGTYEKSRSVSAGAQLRQNDTQFFATGVSGDGVSYRLVVTTWDDATARIAGSGQVIFQDDTNAGSFDVSFDAKLKH